MPLFVLLCALIGAIFLLPLLPALIFVLLMLYGLVKLVESALPSAPKPRSKPDELHSHPPTRASSEEDGSDPQS